MEFRMQSTPAVIPSLDIATPANVVILAAGRGSRLGALGDDTPKWLLPVGGRTIADRQLEGIRAAATAVTSISVVVGHAADAIVSELRGRDDGEVSVVTNREHAARNNWWSVLLALRALPQDEPVVIVNADLLIDAAQVRDFLEAAVHGPAEGLLAVDRGQAVTEESMKVSLGSDATVDAIGKVGVRDPAGEYVGLLMARGATLRAFRAALEAFVDRPEHDNEWYEAAIGHTAVPGAWHVWPVASGGWVEIDDDRDLRAAEALGVAR
jgi:choline kinase